MTGLPRIIAMTLSFRLMEMACHASYPLNSENASPPGTFTVYLSWTARASPTRTERTTTPINIRFFIFSLLSELQHFVNRKPAADQVRLENQRFSPNRCQICRSDVFTFDFAGDASTLPFSRFSPLLLPSLESHPLNRSSN